MCIRDRSTTAQSADDAKNPAPAGTVQDKHALPWLRFHPQARSASVSYTHLDVYKRQVIGWSMSPRMTAQLACDALQMALWRRQRPRNVIVHTDRGGQYCSADYQAQLKRHNLRGSMSAKAVSYTHLDVYKRQVTDIRWEKRVRNIPMTNGIIKSIDWDEIAYPYI